MIRRSSLPRARAHYWLGHGGWEPSHWAQLSVDRSHSVVWRLEFEGRIQLRVSAHTPTVGTALALPMAVDPPRSLPPFWALDRDEGPNGHAASLCRKELFQRQKCKSVDGIVQWQLSKYVLAERKSSRPLTSHQTQRKAVLNGWGFRTITPPSSPVRARQSQGQEETPRHATDLRLSANQTQSPPFLGPCAKRN